MKSWLYSNLTWIRYFAKVSVYWEYRPAWSTHFDINLAPYTATITTIPHHFSTFSNNSNEQDLIKIPMAGFPWYRTSRNTKGGLHIVVLMDHLLATGHYWIGSWHQVGFMLHAHLQAAVKLTCCIRAISIAFTSIYPSSHSKEGAR